LQVRGLMRRRDMRQSTQSRVRVQDSDGDRSA
jgi:hypothetical protein